MNGRTAAWLVMILIVSIAALLSVLHWAEARGADAAAERALDASVPSCLDREARFGNQTFSASYAKRVADLDQGDHVVQLLQSRGWHDIRLDVQDDDELTVQVSALCGARHG